MNPFPPLGPVPRRRSLALRVSIAAVLAFAVCLGSGTWAAVELGSRIDRRNQAPAGSAQSTSRAPESPRSPQAGVRSAWMSAQIEAALAAHAQALLRGDERAFVAIGEPGNTAVAGELRRRYSSLRALRVAAWQPVVTNGPSEVTVAGARDQWQATVSLRHCFVVAGCQADGLLVGTRWTERGGKAVLVKIERSTRAEKGPRPWEVSELRGAAGARTVVATTARYASRLPLLLREAEKAAAVADRFVVGSTRPDIYRIYLAGSDEWGKWFGADRPPWAAGYAVSVSDRRIDVVLNVLRNPDDVLDDILRHEIAHAASLIGARYQYERHWWLTEGLADHAMLYGQPASRHDALVSGSIRQFIRRGRWDGKVAVSAPDRDATMSDAAARYGIAFLAVRRLAERFGDVKMLRFFEAVLHKGHTLETGSQLVFGLDWAGVHADCVRSIRERVG
ncbi:MAG TPA: hypothetical protein VFB84_14875 [Micromonosporaceae bacterium]|nr:hypothetical protein [Micromonosporaceae bacterium]